MTTNPWERLREAVGRFGDFADHAKKCHVTRYRSAGVVNQTLPACTCGFGGATDELRAALAALPPAQTDAEREQAIKAWKRRMCNVATMDVEAGIAMELGELTEEAVALMRSAPQKPAAEEPKPASPASDWRERFEASRNSTAETLCLRDGLIAAEDRIAAVEDRLAKIERGAP